MYVCMYVCMTSGWASTSLITVWDSFPFLPSCQLTATDQDGPINNLVRYSIVSGDPLQQFSIHPRSGEITVRTALDREEVSVLNQ